MLFLFSAKPRRDTLKWQLRVTVDLAAHLGEWRLNQDKVAPPCEGISPHLRDSWKLDAKLWRQENAVCLFAFFQSFNVDSGIEIYIL